MLGPSRVGLVVRLISGFMLVFGACTSASQSADETPVTGTIRLELPAGFVGTLDDLKEPVEPGADHAVLAGDHTVVVQTPCGEHRAQVTVPPGASRFSSSATSTACSLRS